MNAHLVFVTKYRRGVFDAHHLTALKEHVRAICASIGATLLEFNGEVDHVHLLVEYPPALSVSKIVNAVKGVSSRLMRRDFPELRQRSLREHLWSPSYFAGSAGGVTIETLRKYIEAQDAPR